MPVLSGFQSTELIRAYEAAQQATDPTFPRTPIFALTVRPPCPLLPAQPLALSAVLIFARLLARSLAPSQGSSSSEVEQRALSNGFDHFISKPVALKDLWTLLKDRSLV